MAFPTAPDIGDPHTEHGIAYTWNGTFWQPDDYSAQWARSGDGFSTEAELAGQYAPLAAGVNQLWVSPHQYSKDGTTSTQDPSATGAAQLAYHALPDAATTVFFASQILPANWTTYDVVHYFYNPNASGGDVVLAFRLQSYSLGDDAATSTTGSVSNLTHTAAAEDVLESVAAYSGVSYTTGAIIVLYVRRNGAAAGDTLAGDYRFVGTLLTKAS